MRFVFIICWVWAMALLPLHTLADEIPIPETPSPETPIPETPISGIPFSVAGYEISKVAQNLGKITALAVIENDVFVLDSQKNRVWRLRDQNQDGSIDIQTVYLIGFDNARHMVAAQDQLYISDANGIWKSTVGKNLSATVPPINIVSVRSKTSIPLAASQAGLYAGIKTDSFTGIISVDTTTHTVRSFAKNNWNIQALAASPNGQLWAALQTGNGTRIQRISKQGTLTQNPTDENLKSLSVKDMLLWQDHLLLAISHPKPRIIQYGFAYGDLVDSAKPLIGGFSSPSISVGKIDIWGIPTAIAVLGNGNLIFADGENGNIWHVTKSKTQPAKTKASPPITPKKPLEQADAQKSAQPPKLTFGSSISSASSLNYGSAIGKDELLSAKKKPAK